MKMSLLRLSDFSSKYMIGSLMVLLLACTSIMPGNNDSLPVPSNNESEASNTKSKTPEVETEASIPPPPTYTSSGNEDNVMPEIEATKDGPSDIGDGGFL